MATIQGTVRSPNVDPQTVLVLAYAQTRKGPSLLNYSASTSDGQYRLRLPEGEFRIWAFEDLDRDFVLDPGEPLGRLSDGIQLERGAQLSGQDIRLSPKQAPPRWLKLDLSASGYNPDLAPLKRAQGQLVSLDDPRFGPRMTSRGFWRPLNNIERNQMGLFFLREYAPCRTPVLFIHGISGSPADLRALIEQIDPKRFQVWVYSYASAMRLRFVAEHLGESLTELQVKLGFKDLVIIAHSMGGLIARATAQRLERSPIQLRALVTLSTPWNGHERAEDGVRFSPYVAPSWIDMIPGSQFLRGLHQKPLTPPHYLLFGYGKGPAAGPATDGVVTLKSMLDPKAQNTARQVRGYPVSHRGILVHPEVHREVRRILGASGSRETTRACAER